LAVRRRSFFPLYLTHAAALPRCPRRAARPRYSQQEQLYDAIYREASAVNRLLEEANQALTAADAAFIATEVRRFLIDGAWAHQDDTPPAEVLAAEISEDDDAGAPAPAVATSIDATDRGPCTSYLSCSACTQRNVEPPH
jgi:hypothetical protein